jgi:hypothetical protein
LKDAQNANKNNPNAANGNANTAGNSANAAIQALLKKGKVCITCKVNELKTKNELTCGRFVIFS